MLLGCDTMVALPETTRHGQTILAKNSDRPRNECQPLVQRGQQTHAPDAVTRCQFVTLPEVPTTFRHVGSRPYWCWGYEHGFNEYQVVIGNEALPSRLPEAEEGRLVGMELLRLGLERGRTAAEAIEVLTSLISTYGQGRFKNDGGVRTYDNSYLVADPREAYVLETAGHEWAVKRVRGAVGISNVRTIGTDWDRISPTAEQTATATGWWQPDRGRLDFASAYADPPVDATGRPISGALRRARSCAVLGAAQGGIDAQTVMAVLRDHSIGTGDAGGADGAALAPNGLPRNVSICMHYGEDVAVRGGNTAASLVADLCADGSRLPIYWCSFYSPCLGVFFPVFVEGDLPAVLARGGAEPDETSPWWRFRELERAVRDDPSGEAAATVRDTWKPLQQEWWEHAYDLAAQGREMIETGHAESAAGRLTAFMAENGVRMLETVRGLRARLAQHERVAVGV